ncbi:hypothetical protein IFM89_008739 [Coptis chinensis]|uniref:Uncharacterized protein n=1 Tax=Coptis chinensis TaxID=261450 RepID=A0A835LDD4_9MAGN|nr:hypothetical protein IFM89_008739 [Coptis chinensis]
MLVERHVTSAVNWLQHDKYNGIRLKHIKGFVDSNWTTFMGSRGVSSVEWHYRGDYFKMIVPTDILCDLIHYTKSAPSRVFFYFFSLNFV